MVGFEPIFRNFAEASTTDILKGLLESALYLRNASYVTAALICPQRLDATKLISIKTIDKDYIMVHSRDGEVRYRDDTLIVFGNRLDPEEAGLDLYGQHPCRH